jgi:hypothetical protein
MVKKLDLEKIIKKNPQIDLEKLKESQTLLAKLRKNGIRRSTYKLAPPFTRKHPVSIDLCSLSSTETKSNQ